LHIVTAGRTATFREIAAKYPIPDVAKLDLQGLALLNGTTPGASVPRGTLIKVVVP
jgi:hypothetical protein